MISALSHFLRLSVHTTQSTHITTTFMQSSSRLMEFKVKDLMVDKRRLVQVPDNATLADALNTMVANRVIAVPVAAKPGQWLGAGGSMIIESDKQSGSARKQYIGMVTMLDVVAHIAGEGDDSESGFDKKMAAPVSSIIGHSPEGLSLWSLNPNTSIMDCMEMLSKGIHRVLVPMDSNIENISGPELVESASSYAMLTQMDLISFFLNRSSNLQSVLSHTVTDLSAIHDTVLALTSQARVKDAIKCMSKAMLNAVPIVEASSEEEDHKQLVDGRNRRVVGTFSASDLKGCHLATLRSWLPLNALEFVEKIPRTPLFTAASSTPGRELVTCHVTSTLAQVIRMVTTKRVHRVWVVDQNDGLQGLISLTDIIAAVRSALL
ncbi:PREDICTED: SNF1-related protein kinase regulatory subunit gamma-like PV42b isoform X2 [Camelina sativa]|uniref:SNF1-related protein kinase regulatory subunit gamma-like PV42b isoform X1 n=1 Tax=Camelina sativa TaxID=90675 RepID=A0ABM1Q9Y7_CAMSA|nr:PREDICTED: SNF1-related protein kinase regulatory subunit gamma-like PV42b isoform X1 [Camelina sativa]XP_019083575.1 PREDICTED: SNF1-related protein kinase regulatory subunit gamma-like PV42b isoform X2 [Camelina sativa]